MKHHKAIFPTSLISFVLLGCAQEAEPVFQDRLYTVSAGLIEDATRVSLEPLSTSLDMVSKWQEDDEVKVLIFGKHNYVELPAISVRDISDDKKNCHFSFSIPEDYEIDELGYHLICYTIPPGSDNLAKPHEEKENPATIDLPLIRYPIDQFRAPVLFSGRVRENNVDVAFHHLYTYELLHVENKTNLPVPFSLSGFNATPLWFAFSSSLELTEETYGSGGGGGAYSPRRGIKKTAAPVRESPLTWIAPHTEAIIVSAYIPTGAKISDAQMVAVIDGKTVYSSNTISSDIELEKGHAYHMYAAWDGQELRFWKDGEEPLDVRTLTASIDPQYLSGEFTGTVVNPPLSEIKTGFRFWKENNPEDYVEYDSTSSDNGSFSLNLTYNDFVYIANESSVEGKYFVSAFAIDAKGNRHPGNVLEFTIESGQPVTPAIPEAIDLGLPSGMKWASFNLGASKPEEYGDYYAWAETDPKATYTSDTYKWSNGSKLTKYNWDSSSGYSGFVDNKAVLDIEDDAAHVILGGNWRIPSKEEIEELITCCSGIWTTLNDIGGYKLTGPNGNSIFLPASGYKYVSSIEGAGKTGNYHSSTLLDYDVWKDYTMFFNPYQSIAGGDGGNRYLGKTIRPVYADSSSPEIEVTPTDINFETVEYETTKTRPFTVTNTGNGMLSFSISCVCHDNVFEVNDGGATYSLASGASHEFMVTAHGMKRNSKASCDIRVIPSSGDGTKTVSVKAEGWDNKPLTLETSNKTLKVGDECQVNILFGSLDYEITTSDESIVTVAIGTKSDGGGGRYDNWQSTYKYVNMKALATGTATIKVTDKERGEEATLVITVSSGGSSAVPEAVDLGLSVKWASFNLGASNPEEYGDYYAWGETEPHYSSLEPLVWKPGKEAGYVWPSYKWCIGSYISYNTLTKYCNDASYGYEGFTDSKTVLDPDDDAAHVNLGGSWRMPTDAEWTELRENCTWTWTTQNGVNGRLVTGSNGNSIFLPAAGYRYGTSLYDAGFNGDYWSSSLEEGHSDNARYVVFRSGFIGRGSSGRDDGFSVRPVSE